MTDDRHATRGGMDRRTILKGAAAAGLVGGALSGTASALSLPNTIEVRAGETPLRYRIGVSGEIEAGELAGDTDRIVGDDLAIGFVEAGNEGERDSFDFSGRITEFTVSRGEVAAALLNGERVTALLGRPGDPLSNRVTVRAEEETVSYRLRVSDLVAKAEEADGGDRILDSTVVRGTVGGGGTDAFRYSGDITVEEPDGPLTVTLEFDPDRVGN